MNPRDCENGRQIGKCDTCDVARLESVNAELVEALRAALPALEAAWYNESEAHKVRAALAKVESRA